MRPSSLRNQLLQWLLWPLALILVLGATIAYLFALHTATDAYDLSLLDNALDLSRQIESRQGGMILNLPPAAQQMLQVNNEDRVIYAAWDESGRLFSGSSRLLAPGAIPRDGNHLFRDIVVGGEVNREILLRGRVEGKSFYIAVAQTVHARDQLTDGILASILVPETLLALVAIGAVMLGVRRGLAPVQRLRDELDRRSPTDLRPIQETPAPTELVPIIHGINGLLASLATAFASQRRFIADAAHQLRTPLASLSSQIEVGLEEPPSDTKGLLRQLLGTTRRITRLANQLLSLARLEHTERFVDEAVVVELEQVFRDASADIVTLAARKGVELEFDLQPCQVQGSLLLLRELLANLLDNAVRYTPPGGKVVVSLHTGAQQIVLCVADNGPGVPEEELPRLGVPFHRLPSSPPDGCGLGLAIVREIARLHRVDLLFERGTDGSGLRVCVKFLRLPAASLA
ncbi:MAG TPA: sensor histidine kinase N-terminal domain-containing protein [Gallionella sp.]|nr:sensor histidine kinase N-terminal domain-containing protein [Gallionella sp.]